MKHAWTPAPAADPIHAAIERHRAAYGAFHLAPEGDEALFANDDYDAASDALVATACATRFGALALLGYLRWWLADEAEFAAGHQPAYRLAQARAADLTLFLGTNLPPVAIPRAMPSGRLLPGVDRQNRHAAVALHDEDIPGAVEPWQAVSPVHPDTPHSRARRFLDTSCELLTAVAIIAGGVALSGCAVAGERQHQVLECAGLALGCLRVIEDGHVTRSQQHITCTEAARYLARGLHVDQDLIGSASDLLGAAAQALTRTAGAAQLGVHALPSDALDDEVLQISALR